MELPNYGLSNININIFINKQIILKYYKIKKEMNNLYFQVI